MNAAPASVYYLYGFAWAGATPETDLGVGVDEGRALFIWTHDKIAAILSLVSSEDFCGPNGEENLQNLDWIGPRACRHHAVIDRAMRQGPVLPTRFGTLFSSLESLGKYLLANAPAIVQFLERTAGQEEWAVRGLIRRGEAEAWARARLVQQDEPAGISPGAAYLRDQSLRIKAKRELDFWLAETCGGLLQELEAMASAACQRKIPPHDAANAGGDIVLNWAFLVPRPALADFRIPIERANDEHGARGLMFELSGPWPPYSFPPVLEIDAQPPRSETPIAVG